jgi:hypothetical protein
VVDVWHIHIIPPDAAADILAAALAGNAEARRLLPACGKVHRRLARVTEPSNASSSCAICDRGFWRARAPEVIVLVAEYGNDDAAPSTFGICGRCYTRHHSTRPLMAAALDGSSALLGISLRQLPPIAMTGHA